MKDSWENGRRHTSTVSRSSKQNPANEKPESNAAAQLIAAAVLIAASLHAAAFTVLQKQP